jgi:CheY-like chemotaxis protein
VEPPCVLVADDRPEIRLLIRTVLARGGYRVLEAANGIDALTQARQKYPAVAILDHVMPGMSGLDVAAALAGDPDTAHIRTIITSIAVAADDKGAAQRAGVDAYLPKPFGVQELLTTVAQLLADES